MDGIGFILGIQSGLRPHLALGLHQREGSASVTGEPKAVRIFSLLSDLLESRIGGTKAELAERFGVNKRTIERDLALILEAGESLGFELVVREDATEAGENRYQIVSHGPGIVSLSLNPDEAFLFAYCMALARRESLPRDRGALETLSRKVEELLPRTLQDQADRMARLYVSVNRPVPNIRWDLDTLRELEDAITSQDWIRFQYENRDGVQTTWTVAPTAILTYQGRLYLLGRSLKRLNQRPAKFAISRIREVEILDGEAGREIPEADFPQETGDPRELLGDAFGLFDEDPFDFEALFSGEAVETVQNTLFHPTQNVELLPGDRARFTMRAGGYYEILWWVLGFGEKVEVVKPERMREEMGETASNVIKQYRRISE